MECHFLTCDYSSCAIDFANLFAKFSFKASLSWFCNIYNWRGFYSFAAEVVLLMHVRRVTRGGWVREAGK